jgi:hypothetical protein
VHDGWFVPLLTVVNVDPGGSPVTETEIVFEVSDSAGLMFMLNAPEFWQILK